MRSFLIILIFLVASSNVVAETNYSIDEKIVSLKEKMKTHFEGMPKLGFFQKIKVGSVLKTHRKEIRKIIDQIRPNAIKIREECHQILTHEQLLKIMDFQNTLLLRTRGEKAAIILQKLNNKDRSQLLQIVQTLSKSEVINFESNLNKLHYFKVNTLFPYYAEHLKLTASQQQQILDIVKKHRRNILPLVVKLLEKLRALKENIRAKLSLEQINFLDNNRNKIIEDVVAFIENL